MAGQPLVGVIMGSDSDWKTLQFAAQALADHGIPHETRVVSAHRSPDYLFEYAGTAETRGLALIIAGAGGAAHLPGMTAAKTIVPVVGVPVVATPLNGLDALLSILQMPAEVGVATMGAGEKGARDAGLFAAAVLAGRRGASVALLAETDADRAILHHAERYLERFQVAYRTLTAGGDLAAQLEAAGAGVVLAASSRGIDFACRVGRTTRLPVLGVPILAGPVASLDDYLRPFQDMPPGVASFAVGKPGAINAALFAATILHDRTSAVWSGLRALKVEQVARVRGMIVPT